MRYLPKSPSNHEIIYARNGVGSIDDLFAPSSRAPTSKGDLEIPRQMAEWKFLTISASGPRRTLGYTSSLGAGAYNHYRPVVIDAHFAR